MALKRFRPVTSGSRFRTIVHRSEITRSEPERSLTEGLAGSGGRNHHGHMTVRRRGGGHKRRYRKIDFRRDKHGIPGRVTEIEYDPNRSANIALVTYADGEKRYILHPRGLGVGDTVLSGPEADIAVGHAMALSRIPLGTTVHNVELTPGKGGPDGPVCGHGRECGCPGGQVRDASPALHRGPSRAPQVPGDDRPGRQPRPRASVARQGGREAVAPPPSEGQGRRDEPGRPSLGRWGRTQLWRTPSRLPLGEAGGKENAATQEVLGPLYRSRTSAGQGNQVTGTDWRAGHRSVRSTRRGNERCQGAFARVRSSTRSSAAGSR